MGNFENQGTVRGWMENYVNVLCINSWQVKRYIDVYSTSSVIGFSSDDLLRISNLYSQAEKNWSAIKNKWSDAKETDHSRIDALKRQIVTYSDFLLNVVELARSKWTEFDLKLMAAGFGIMLLSLYIHFLAILGGKKSYATNSWISSDAAFTLFIVLIRACSFLSNSYILEEGKVANFLLATTGLIKLRYSIIKRMMRMEAITLMSLSLVLRVSIEIGLSKQAAASQFMNSSPSWILGIGIAPGHPTWTYTTEVAPILSLIVLAYMLYKAITWTSCEGIWKYVIVGSMISYFLIAVHWASETKIFGLCLLLQGIGRNRIPRAIYAIGFGQLLLLASTRIFNTGTTSDCKRNLVIKMVAILSACSSTIVLLSGKQGSMIALAFLISGYCITRLAGIQRNQIDGIANFSNLDPLSVTQWSLLAVCMFFATGHWCAFDGLRYGAAFVGFDEFVLVRQAILLAIETFGFSNIISVFGLPLIVAYHAPNSQNNEEKKDLLRRLFQMYMVYGLIMATTVTATILCVTIQRRHLMVWGLFAPKFVFDVVGLIITDVLICLASVYYLD